MGEPNERLIKARKAAGWKSARSAAIDNGWVPSTYASYENGQTPLRLDRAKVYGQIFKINPWYLICESDDPRQGAGPADGHGSIDAMLIGQPDEVRREVQDVVEAILRNRGPKPVGKGQRR